MNEKILSVIKKFNMVTPGDCILVGLSGGADSCTLLHVLSNISKRLDITLVAAHLNHGIRGQEALRDQEFSREFCETLGITFVTQFVSVPEYAKENRLSLETAARIKRYEFFDEVSKEYKCSKIAVAHNKNDNAETILFNLIRGSGAKGLEGISPVNGKIIRPLIECTRSEIEEYLLNNKLKYVDDSTNFDDAYSRNIVRNKIIPNMNCINSGALNNIIRCSEIIKNESEYLEYELQNKIKFKKRKDSVELNRNDFVNLNPVLASRAVFKAINLLCNSTTNISSKQVELLTSSVKTGNKFSFGNGSSAYVTSEKIIFTLNQDNGKPYSYGVCIPGIIHVEETGISYKFEYVDSCVTSHNALCINADNLSNLIIRTRSDGDFFIPYGMSGVKKIKKFFIDLKIPQSERDKYPLLIGNDDVLAVIPLRINEKYKVTEETKKILMITQIGGTYDKL